jgi:hypothetical protein
MSANRTKESSSHCSNLAAFTTLLPFVSSELALLRGPECAIQRHNDHNSGRAPVQSGDRRERIACAAYGANVPPNFKDDFCNTVR